MELAVEKFLSDYTPSNACIHSVDLTFTISDGSTVVRSLLDIEMTSEGKLHLDGVELELLSIRFDGETLPQTMYTVYEEYMEVSLPKKRGILEIINKIYPEKNTALEGLYHSGSMYCTQNEPEGFRKITYFLDRPDVMTVFTTKIIAPKKYPILLSNGNLVESGEIDDTTHFTVWHDPFPKPSYLFALVAGDLGKISDTFVTMSGRTVDLHIFSEHGNESKCLHAMESLKRSMKWDEEVYGREYDLDVFHIVATDSFNMGAMENKSLNIFNTIYVLADLDTATDRDFINVESVIGHEYFHNWTGNRITCRNWFQLTLKEGLTVFRDHDFSGDMNSRDTMRIEDIRDLREYQFGEDAGPTAHPIQPASYIEMNNFYTATVYEKGSEVIRMMATLLGKEKFRKAMDLYFDTFDGQAVTTQDFVWAMSTAGNIDLTQFEETWYHQERTPELIIEGEYNSNNKTYTITLTQKTLESTKGMPLKPFFYPLGIALLNTSGDLYPLSLQDSSMGEYLQRNLLIVSKEKETFTFNYIESEPVLSINRGFTAPIKTHFSEANLAFLMKHETDGFARYEAGQKFALSAIYQILQGNPIPESYIEAYGYLLEEIEDKLYHSLLLSLPSVNNIAYEYEKNIDFQAIIEARSKLAKAILSRYESEMLDLYSRLYSELPETEGLSKSEIATRSLLASLLDFLTFSEKGENIISLAENQYQESKTMTLRLSALSALYNLDAQVAQPYMGEFYEKYKNNTVVMMKYFSLMALSDREDTISTVRSIQTDPAFDPNLPNHIKSLIGAFTRNPKYFHEVNGKGYELLTDAILSIDPSNPHTSARIAGAYKIYPKLSGDAKVLMQQSLDRILSTPDISKHLFEIVSKIRAS